MNEFIMALICNYSFVIEGMGCISGNAFSKVIRSVYDCDNPRNLFFSNLAEKHILTIEVHKCGKCSYSIS